MDCKNGDRNHPLAKVIRCLSNEHYDIHQTFDKGYIILGHLITEGDEVANGNFLLIVNEQDSIGIHCINRVVVQINEYGYSIRQTIDSGYIAGATFSNRGSK